CAEFSELLICCVFIYTTGSVYWNLIRGIYAREKTHLVIFFAHGSSGGWRWVIAGAKNVAQNVGNDILSFLPLNEQTV
ncbi:hypothetical protein RCN67_21315, partial [Escherichia marmotae]|nr:hypothetical protein [Escherichia marmotae]